MYLKDVRNLGDLIKWADGEKLNKVDVELSEGVFKVVLSQFKGMKGLYGIDMSRWQHYKTEFRGRTYIIKEKQNE